MTAVRARIIWSGGNGPHEYELGVQHGALLALGTRPPVAAGDLIGADDRMLPPCELYVPFLLRIFGDQLGSLRALRKAFPWS